MTNHFAPRGGSRARTAGVALLLLMFWAEPARGDRGYVPTQAKVRVREPAQRAIIAHDGTHELLILQTEIKASRRARVVEFMPLPAKPEISLAEKNCFAALGALVKRHNLSYPARRRAKKKNGGSGGHGGDAVRVVVAKQLGPHDITVAEVKDADAFVDWTRAFFRDRRLGAPAFGQSLRTVVAAYLAKDIRFFAFDVIDVGRKKTSVQPITYAFDSPVLYYPLVVTNSFGGGQGVVELFVVSEDGISIEDPGGLFVASTSARVTAEELAPMHAALPVFVHQRAARLVAHRYSGELRFQRDLELCVGYDDPEVLAREFVRGLRSGDTSAVMRLVGRPFAHEHEALVEREADLRSVLAGVTALPEAPVDKSIAIEIDLDYADLTGITTSQIILERYGFVAGQTVHDYVRSSFESRRHLTLVWLTLGSDKMLVIAAREGCEPHLYRVVGFVRRGV